jgi:hypothetical protein
MKGGERVKKEISPAIMAAVIVCVLVFAGFFLYRASTAKPVYIGDGVGPGGGPPMTKESGQKMMQMMNKAKDANTSSQNK